MFPSAYLLLLLAQPIDRPLNAEMVVTPGVNSVDLAWNDAEDRIQGSVTPRIPVEGTPIEVSVHVGSFQGPEFDGPVTVSFKPADATGGGLSKTVKKAAGERAWRASFLPEEAGLYTLEVSFSTTRMKVVSGKVRITEARLPRWPWWTMVGLAAALALGLGVRSVFKKQENM